MNLNFLINTLTSWDEPPRARHQVANALAKKYPVVFVASNRIGFPGLRKQQMNQNLCVITPYSYIDRRIRVRIPLLNRIYQKWLYKKLSKIYPEYNVINFDFTALYLHSYFKNIIYYCNDDHIGLSYLNNLKWIAHYHKRCETVVIQHSKLCIATSRFLAERIKTQNNNTYEIRLGAPDLKDIRIACKKSVKDVNLIHVGFVGYINTIDSEIITSLLSKGDIYITIVGPVNKKAMNGMQQYKNLRMTGTLTGQALYDEVNNFDVGIIPYDLNIEIDRTPNKLWLYLSLGKPAVISNIKGIRDWEFPDKYLYRAEDGAAFYELIKKAFSEDSEELLLQRINFAEKNTWENRIEDFLKLYQNTFNN